MKVLLITTEPSGDKLGANLIDGLRNEFGSSREIDLQGIGGPLMQERGLLPLFDYEDLSVMGFSEVVPKLFHLLKIIRRISKYAIAWQPDVVITIDSPDFSLRIAKSIKKSSQTTKIVHYVLPSVWAWRPKRARRMSKFVDHVLAILPFEPPYMHNVGVSCDFVGHPIVSEELPSNKEIRLFRNSLGISTNTPIVSILPGSRKSEVERMMPLYCKMMSIVTVKFPSLIFIIPSLKGVSKLVDKQISKWKLPVIHLTEDHNPLRFEQQKKVLFSTSLAAVATSGTVSLELAKMGAPTIVCYRASLFTELVLRLLVNLESATLINILNNRLDIPELLFSKCTYRNISAVLISLLLDDKKAEEQRKAVNNAMMLLGLKGVDPKLRAARSVLGFLEHVKA
ncbi:MAG: lipid-A-disaccharide synthase [Pseudomonadota bacterium]|nr:lipid-A-disaccharide synthase [Pseudomonadota bacterium]